MNEKDVVRRLVEDRDAGFVALVRWSSGDLYRGLVRMVRDRQTAEDLSQETYLRAWNALQNYPDERIRQLRLRGWLWTIAMNRGRSHLSRAIPTMDRPETSRDVGEAVAESDACERLLANLSESNRVVVVLRHVVGLSYVEISEAVGRPVGTIKSDVHRSLNQLRNIGEGP